MYLDFAPLEGITTALFRRLHHQYFPGVDRYFSPFLSPTQEHRFTPREQREILPEYNEGLWVIPQLLTKNADDFLWAAGELAAMGYKEINLNLGCPSGTVTAKGKGAGMLADLMALDRFLDRIYSAAPCSISVKTRLGMDDPEEFQRILELYDRYPISELIIHPRVRRDLYRHPVRREIFDDAYSRSRNPVSYNGSILTPEDHAACAARYPKLTAIMVGQALVSDPFLAQRISTGASSNRETLRTFLAALLDGYTAQFGSRTNAMKRMKDVWFYLIQLFGDCEKQGKRILKAKTVEEYELAVSTVLRELPLLDRSAGRW